MSLIEVALAHAARGWAVFPVHAPTPDGECDCGKVDCEHPAKHPATPRGFKDATTDPQLIREMWGKHPGANIGLATGQPSGLIVLDVDGPKGAEVVKRNGIPLTPVGKTGKGRHYYLRHPGFPVKNVARVFDELDSRGDGGYVVAPGSQHISGTLYAWEDGFSPDDVPLAAAPEWWLERLQRDMSRDQPLAVASPGLKVMEGNRNDCLAREAGKLRRLGYGQDMIFNALCEKNRSLCFPPLSVDEVGRIAQSIAQYEPELLPSGTTEDGLALEFTSRHAEDWRFVAAWGQWFHWDGACWRAESTLRAYDLARNVCRNEAARCPTPAIAARIASAATVAAVERLAKADRKHAATSDQWDMHPWLLNTPTGAVDLQSGDLRPHRREDYFTKVAGAAPGGDCPLWRQFLRDVTDGDEDLQAYLARVAGYALTGVTREHALFFLYGTGANGKSVFLNTLAAILADYATIAPVDTFLETKSDRHPTDLAALRGARLVSSIEIDQGKRWAEAKLKALTGGDVIAARFMRQDFFEYRPQFKLFVAGNHKPAIRGVDEAMRRRLHLIPFTVTIAPEKRDKTLPERLLAERDGIMAWAIQGCLDWHQGGLQPPEAVTGATRDYFTDEDALGRWLGEACRQDPNATATTAALFAAWETWAKTAGEWVGSKKDFSIKLKERGFQKWDEPGTRKRGFRGVALA
jgi:P4 family phage/plasmid primase-like protien